MRLISIALLVGLAGCLIAGGGQVGASSPPAGDQALPRNLVNASDKFDKLNAGLTKLEEEQAAGGLADTKGLHSLRTMWRDYFSQMVGGGKPAFTSHPRYREMKAATPQLNARFAALEKAAGSCAYGYRMPNGELLEMTLDWSEQDWKGVVAEALPPAYSQKERCWRDTDDGRAGKPGAWEY